MIDVANTKDQVIRFQAVGDVMLGDQPVRFGHGVRSMVDKHGFPFLFEHTRNIFLNTDILFGNLETVLAPETDSKNLYDQEMKGRTAYAKHLSQTGFNIMSIANNHAMQHGMGTFRHTVTTLQEAGIQPVGLNNECKSNCCYFENNGITLAIIAYSFRPEKYTNGTIPYANNNEESLLAQIRELNKLYSHVIVSIHWGEEYLHYPSVDQAHFAKRMVDSGARLILGHHPHVLQGIEEYKNSIIVYSLGNFIFDHWQRKTRETIIFECHFRKDAIHHYKVIPVYINENYQPVPLTGSEANKLDSKINRYSSAIHALNDIPDTKEQSHAYQAIAKKAYDKYRTESYIYFLRNIHRYNFSTLLDSLLRFIKRRIDPSHP